MTRVVLVHKPVDVPDWAAEQLLKGSLVDTEVRVLAADKAITSFTVRCVGQFERE